jgi:hypothetical protein
MALLAATMLLGMFAFDRHARLASYDIYATAFTVGCAYFLILLAESAPRPVAAKLLLTVAAGVCLGLALLAKGPAPAATVLMPLLVWLAVYHPPGRRVGVWLAVGGMVLVGILTFAPWVLAVIARHPRAVEFWKAEFLKLSTSRDPNAPAVMLDTIRPWYYYLQAFIWSAPFVPLFFLGLCLPFLSPKTPAQRELRRGRWLAWTVTVGGFVLLSIPAVKELRYAIQLLPFVALLCGTALQECAAWLEHKRGAAWTARAGVAFLVSAWILAVAVNGINRSMPVNHTNDFRPGVERAAKIVGRSPAAVLRLDDMPPRLATAYYFERPIPQLIVEWVAQLAAKHPGEPVYVLEWSPVEQKESWQLKAVEQLTKRKTETMMTFEAQGRRLTVTKLDVPVLLIGSSSKEPTR